MRRTILTALDVLDHASQCVRAWALATANGSEVSGLAARVAELERTVAELAPVPVVQRRRSHSPCRVCGGGVMLVLDGAPANGDWINGLCAGCRTLMTAHTISEVIP